MSYDSLSNRDRQEGSQFARDMIIMSIIGMQNKPDVPWGSDECKHYQNVLDMIIKRFGNISQRFEN